MTAGHNALRGSGPGQNPAFDIRSRDRFYREPKKCKRHLSGQRTEAD
jgi:hypothetical protein